MVVIDYSLGINTVCSDYEKRECLSWIANIIAFSCEAGTKLGTGHERCIHNLSTMYRFFTLVHL